MKTNNNDLAVFFEGVPVCALSERLIERQKCHNNIDTIKKLHVNRLNIQKSLENTDDVTQLKDLAIQFIQNEFLLQDAWNFPRNAKFHRFWSLPKCSCPKMDNEDAYPTGYYTVNQECKLHGN